MYVRIFGKQFDPLYFVCSADLCSIAITNVGSLEYETVRSLLLKVDSPEQLVSRISLPFPSNSPPRDQHLCRGRSKTTRLKLSGKMKNSGSDSSSGMHLVGNRNPGTVLFATKRTRKPWPRARKRLPTMNESSRPKWTKSRPTDQCIPPSKYPPPPCRACRKWVGSDIWAA